MIGVRIGRNSPVLFVEAGESDNTVGDQVIVALCDGTSGEEEASVVIGKDQLIHASVDRLVGRVLRNVQD